MPNIESVGTALLITFGFVAVSIFIVATVMWWVYRFFRNENDTPNQDE